MNKFFNNVFALAIFGFLMMFSGSAVFAQSKTEVLIVADRRAECTGVSKMKCLQVKKPQDEKWSSLFQNIENFDYAEGYTYIVRVRVDQVKNPAADGSNLKYTLRKILHRERTAENSAGGNSNANAADLTANAWRLEAIDGAAVSAEKAFVRFDDAKKSAGGNGGCNSFGGSFERSGNQLKISQVFSTKMFCEATQAIEDKFLNHLQNVTRYEIRGGRLYLYAGEKAVLEFTKQS